MSKAGADRRLTHANPGSTATDRNLTGQAMANIRTANTRHKRAIVARLARQKAADVAVPAAAAAEQPVKAAD